MVRWWEWYVDFDSAMSSVVQEGEAARAGGKGREIILFYFFSFKKRRAAYSFCAQFLCALMCCNIPSSLLPKKRHD